MKKIFYEKVGRRYKPVYEYDSVLLDAFPRGNHLISVYPGGSSRRYNVDPAYAPMIAAGRVAEDAISAALIKAGEVRMQKGRQPLTPGQKAAWENLVKEFGEEAKQLEWPSAREVSVEGVKAMIKEAESLLTNEAIKKAYEHFMLVVKLTSESEKT